MVLCNAFVLSLSRYLFVSRYLGRSCIIYFVRYFVRSFVRQFLRSFGIPSFAISFVRPFVISVFVRYAFLWFL